MTDRQPKASWAQMIIAAVILVAVIGGLFVLILRSSRLPAETIKERQPGMDRPSAAGSAGESSPFLSGKLTAGVGSPAALPGTWPQFRGPKGDGIAVEIVPISEKWTPLWSVDLGEGYAGAAVRDGRV